MHRILSRVLAALLAAGGVPSIAQAQDDTETMILPPIEVQARKRTEDAQDVPFALSVVDGEALEEERIRGAEDLFRNVPNFSFNGFNSSRFTYYTIRGVGPLSQPLSPDDNSVVTYVDGVPRPLFGADAALLDIEQVEVLRGPQGTLFGRNASAGAINITTRKPADEPEFTLRAEYGEEDTRLGEASASGMIVKDKLGARVALRYWGADDYVNNIAGEDLGDFDNFAGRGSLAFTPSDRTTVTFSGYGQRDRQNPPVFVLLQEQDYPEAASTLSDADRDSGGAGLVITHDLDWSTLTSVTGFSLLQTSIDTDDADGLVFENLFGLPAGFFGPETDISDWDEEDLTVSQEIRLNSPEGAPFAWVGGLSYYHEDFDARYENSSAFFGPLTNGTRDIDLTSNSISAFGEVTVPVFERLKVTTGLRYSYDWKEYRSAFDGNGAPGTAEDFEESGDLDYSYVTGRVALSYDVTDESTLYATVANGYKDGGFPRFPTDSAVGIETDPYKSATNWSYEIGAKNRLWGGRALVDLALFFNDVTDEQLYAFDGSSGTFRPANVDVESYGVELESSIRLAPGLDLTATFAYTESNLRNVPDELALTTGAESGNEAPNLPKASGSLGLQYFGPATWLGLPEQIHLLARLEDQYVGGRFAEVGSALELDDYHLLNARLGLDFEMGELYMFGTNLLDQQYEINGNHYAAGTDAGVPGRGRIVGIGGALRF